MGTYVLFSRFSINLLYHGIGVQSQSEFSNSRERFLRHLCDFRIPINLENYLHIVPVEKNLNR